MTAQRSYEDLALATGRAWAELKADTLEGEIPALAWPDAWDPAWAGRLELSPDQRMYAGAQAAANHAAAERWRELVHAQRMREDAGEVARSELGPALSLLEAVRQDLPPGLRAGNEGARVYLVDEDGSERTIHSLEHAWRVVAEYDEHRSLRTS